MADLGGKAAKQLGEITECPICMSAFSDPRMLPCIHTFCLECLKRTAEADQKKPGDKMPCPLCRKDFIIPEDGMNGVQKNFFMENLLEFKTTLQIGSAIIICDMCNVRNVGKSREIPKATMRCFECHDNYCDSCVKVHQFQKLSRNHQLVKIGSETATEMKLPIATINCTKHPQKPLDYYCADCKKIVCVSCFVESHAWHRCKDVTTVDEFFRQTIQMNLLKTSNSAEEMLSIKKNAEIRKEDFLRQIAKTEDAIRKRNRELKDILDEHTESLVNELSVVKSNHLKEMETGMQEIDRYFTILRSFEEYCSELIARGSASDICSSVDQLTIRADELERGKKIYICNPQQSVDVSFQSTDLKEALQKSKNFLGQIKGIVFVKY